MVAVGMWVELSELVHQCAASKGGLLNETRQRLLKHCLTVMDTTVNTLYHATTHGTTHGTTHDHNCAPLPPLVHEAFARTGIQALLHLVEALAESQKVGASRHHKKATIGRRNTSQFNRHVASPIPFLGTTGQSLRIMLRIASHNIDVLHYASSGTGTRNELYHIFAYLLEWCTDSSSGSSRSTTAATATAATTATTLNNLPINHAEEMEADHILEQTIVLMGYYARGSTERQQSLHWGSHPTPLQRLCNLPFQFFSLESSKEILFPTLISICHQDERNRSVVEDEISTGMLHKFIQDRMVDGATGTTKYDSFATRFPKSRWQDALDFLAS